jgi:hypothetical protein
MLLEEFSEWLTNCEASESNDFATEIKNPRQLLDVLDRYAPGPLNKYVRSLSQSA